MAIANVLLKLGAWDLIRIQSVNVTILTPWLESASELYLPSDRRPSAKLLPTFADTGVSHDTRSKYYLYITG
jgi:hypothetical protein